MVQWPWLLCFQGQVANTVTIQNLAIEGFTGNQVWNKSIGEVFPSSLEEHFLHMKVVDSGQGNGKRW